VWDKITAYLRPSSALNATDVFGFKSNAYDRVWTAVFRTEDWLESCSAKDVNIVLIGADLDILSGLTMNKAQPRLVLAAFDRRSELQYENDLLHLSLRGGTPGLKEHQLEQLTLAVSRLDVPEVLGRDFCYLFFKQQGIQTKYCYWRDPEKKIRTLCSQDIRGVDGQITQIQNLRPILLLNLNPPTQTLPDSSESPSSDPVQFVFRCFGGPSFWTGCPPLVHVMLNEGCKNSQWEYTFEGFTFKDEKYRQCHCQGTDWNGVAEVESGWDCSVIRTL
jgi:hypothetical protein